MFDKVLDPSGAQWIVKRDWRAGRADLGSLPDLPSFPDLGGGDDLLGVILLPLLVVLLVVFLAVALFLLAAVLVAVVPVLVLAGLAAFGARRHHLLVTAPDGHVETLPVRSLPVSVHRKRRLKRTIAAGRAVAPRTVVVA